MNYTLSEGYIQKIYNSDLGAIKSLYTDVISDTEEKTRNQQQLGVYNRSLLKAAKTHTPFGRDATGIPVLKRVDPKTGVLNTELNLFSHTEYVKLIAQNKAGYLSGFEVTGSNDSVIEDFNNRNGVSAMFNTVTKDTTMWGVSAYRLYRTIAEGVKLSKVNPWEYTAFYNEVGELALVFQTKAISKSVQTLYNGSETRVSVLTPTEELHFYYDGNQMLMNDVDYPRVVEGDIITKESGVRRHFFNGIPFVEFFNNSEKLGDVESSLELQDVIDELMSKANCGFGTFADHILTDQTTEDNGDGIKKSELDSMAKGMRDYGVLLHGKWAWLAKKYEGYEALFKHLQLLEEKVYQNSNSYNPNSLGGDGSAPTKYQIEQKMKLLSDSAVETENQFTRSFRELYRLALTYGSAATGVSTKPLDLKIAYIHTIPEDKIASLKMASEGGFMVAQEMWSDALGYKYDEVKKMQETDKKSVMNQLDTEADE